MQTILEILLPIVVSALMTWLLNWRKDKIATAKEKACTDDLIVEAALKLVEPLKNQVKELSDELGNTKTELKSNEQKTEVLEKKVNKLQVENGLLKRIVNRLAQQVRDLGGTPEIVELEEGVITNGTSSGN